MNLLLNLIMINFNKRKKNYIFINDFIKQNHKNKSKF